MPRNDDPFAPWNSPMHRDNPFAAHNNPMHEDNPFKPWNEPFGSVNDLNDKERESYNLTKRNNRNDDWEDDY
jgi:hypothetical protein